MVEGAWTVVGPGAQLERGGGRSEPQIVRPPSALWWVPFKHPRLRSMSLGELHVGGVVLEVPVAAGHGTRGHDAQVVEASVRPIDSEEVIGPR